MGYYTSYKLAWEPENPAVEEFIRQKQDEEEDFCYAIEPDGSCADSCKWYEHDDDMKTLSQQFPDTVFTLSGEGEEAEDIWKKYYKNGKSQTATAKIEIAEFDPAKLK